ncbi:Glutathione synthase/Ribosomal protein S6 modification enzyme (glutaminyl transferase) [Salinivirga cyanobacteriivorans]|uniref:Glutathione synthase/Ribosomal protein S6 modification enzyme (Glutaminyl transferase) n=1 Tax=Salinivirga cyanobacteriivorans TaxID=1307839 RepID=A0A0S2I0H2_9BACT|nr:hypothetical protein [Salinivirga cyanobacteriivorans]ALO15777.1 Glutathione synthase/Ribosomal protein S6 modification enzyme (glutaminyl transferase) [Salinivirga cyanobacteriivorans]
MNKIIALQDYKGRFGSKHFDKPYRSGMEKEKLKKHFADCGYDLEFLYVYKAIPGMEIVKDVPVIYTSQEDINYLYKTFIEDVVLSLQDSGAKLIPEYKYLRANNNKVFMERLRKSLLPDFGPQALTFGSLEEAEQSKLQYPLVLKVAEGASGRGVFLIKNKKQLIKALKEINRKDPVKERLKEWLRPYKYKGYIREDKFRRKFILQPFIPNLKNDWKVYVFGERLYVFKRPILKGRGIKASGGGYDNYYYGLEAEAPTGLFNHAQSIYNRLNVPHVSLDIAYDGTNFHLIEFQALYFGTAGIPYSKGYFKQENQGWHFVEEKLEIEQVYADAIVEYLKPR